MTIENLKTKVENIIDDEGLSSEIFFLMKDNGELKIKAADIDQDTQSALTIQFSTSIKKQIIQDEELTLLETSNADDRKNVIYKYDLENTQEQFGFFEQVLTKTDFESFNFNTDNLSEISGIIIILGNYKHQLVIYKHQYPIYLLSKNNEFSLKRIGNQNRFERVKDDILKITPTFDFLYVSEELFITDISLLERAFGFKDALINGAKKGIASISESNLIENVDILTMRLNELPFARKLLKASRNSPVLGIIPFNTILNFTNLHPALIGKFHLNATGTKFDLKTKVSQNLFIKILNDDLLQSELTNLFYDSIAKDNIKAELLP